MKTFRIKFSNHENALNGPEIRDNKSLRSVLHKITFKKRDRPVSKSLCAIVLKIPNANRLITRATDTKSVTRMNIN